MDLETDRWQVRVAPGSVTADALSVVCDPPREGGPCRIEAVSGRLRATTDRRHLTLRGLAPATEHVIDVRVVDARTGQALASRRLTAHTRPVAAVVDVHDCGARGDGRTPDTMALQRAIDRCPAGGIVHVPAGDYLTGALMIRRALTLDLAEGATLRATADPAGYPIVRCRFEGIERDAYASLIDIGDLDGPTVRGVAITGNGTIDATGCELRRAELDEAAAAPGRAVVVRNAEQVCVRDVTIRQSPAWCLHVLYARDVTIDSVGIHTKYAADGTRYRGMENGDGIDIDSCQDVSVLGAHIASEDDCIAIKSGKNEDGRRVGRPSERVRITGCRFDSGFGVAVGSETSGGVRDVLVDDCDFRDVFSALTIKSRRGRGNVVERLRFADLRHVNTSREYTDCRWFRGAINIDLFYEDHEVDAEPAPVSEATPTMRGIEIERVTVDTVGGTAVYVWGLPESPIENLRLVDVDAVGLRGLVAANVEGLELTQTSIRARPPV